MRFEILVEDKSGKRMLQILLPKILGGGHEWRIFSYRGVGRIPKGLAGKPDLRKRLLLNDLPMRLRGYGKAFRESREAAVVIVVCDLDKRDREGFLAELRAVLVGCDPAPETRFCLAIEEGEAWLLGDPDAIRAAYPKARKKVLESYRNDSICGAWERLADAIHPGGAQALRAEGWQTIGAEKSRWAERIAPHMAPDRNRSPSFAYFRDEVRALGDNASREHRRCNLE
uniref:DUF4276 family protein n=1 Tax=Candidatus Kentrum sp. UNK TaxID=2126344 RepID=A0A451A7S6_9GAMM|nr:MAG: protein of unknown function (DUF4276) [Candidatus Kentron sp. UNK]VFK70368.1 MAG: protein of unknown function (DUF4276) [Candidatus Kentron sp. UNK]